MAINAKSLAFMVSACGDTEIELEALRRGIAISMR